MYPTSFITHDLIWIRMPDPVFADALHYPAVFAPMLGSI
jgi:hypothetical protein